MKTRFFIYIPSFLLFLSLAGILFWACSNGEAADAGASENVPVKQVRTVQARKVLHRYSVFASGQLAGKEESRLSFKTGGIIRWINVREGQTVQKGQLLAELDLDEIEAQAQQARLGEKQAFVQLENARLGLEKAKRDFANVEGLYGDSVATEEQLKDTRTLLNNAQNQVEAAEAGLEYARRSVEVADFNLRYSRILAPSRGTILSKMAEVNELATPGRPIFLFGSKDKAQVIRVNITDKDIISIRLGDSAKIQFDAYPDVDFAGVVQEISSKADPYTNTFQVEVEVLPAGRRLFSGFVGKVEIQTRQMQEMIRIPVDALISADGHDGIVYVEKDNRVKKRRVRIQKLEEEGLLVRSGLEAGEEVVVAGGSYLEENDSVYIGQK
jgi:RND family efflux transporter MFP subunit